MMRWIMERLGRNQPCRCGSGKKFKQCCLPKERRAMSEPNGVPVAEPAEAPKELPAIQVGWDAEHQLPTIRFDNKQFTNWVFVEHVLLMAVRLCQQQEKMNQFQIMQQAQQEAMRDQALRQKLALG